MYNILNCFKISIVVILPQNTLRRDFNGKCVEQIEGHYFFCIDAL